MKNINSGGATASMKQLLKSMAIIAIALPLCVQAQEGDSDEAMEEIVVVGSHIEGLSEEAMPVTVMTSDEIRDLGASSMFDILGQIPSVGDFEFEDNSTGTNAVRGDVAGINLRGIGTGNTLLLVNGRRMVVHPTFQAINSVPSTFYNANSIPASAVSRIEVLRDGASAVYGADASAGVVNIVTRGPEDGFQVSVKFASGDTSYDENEITGGGGWTVNEGKTEIGLFATYYERSSVHIKELGSLNFDLDRRNHPEIPADWQGDSQLRNTSTRTPWAQFSVGALDPDLQFIGSTFHVDPTTELLVAGGSAERYNFNETAWVTPEVERFNVLATVNHELSNGMEFFGEASFYNSESNTQRAASPIDDGLAFLIVPAAAFYNTTGQDALITRWRPTDLGPRIIEVEQDTFRILGGIRGDFDKWSWESALMYSEAEATDVEKNRQAKSLFINQLMVAGPDAINPFVGPGGNTQAALDGIRVSYKDVRTSDITLLDYRLNRADLFQAPGGAVGFATGIEWRRDTYDDNRDPRLDGSQPFVDGPIFDESDIIGMSATFDSNASRNTTSLFGELFIPLVSEANANAFTKALEIQLALRYEDTNDFGDTTKPKIFIRWETAGGFALRGSYSEGFRAPNLPQMNQGTIVRRSDGIADPLREVVTGLPIDTGDTYRRTTRTANSNLGPEDTETITYGFVYAPYDGPLAGLTITADWFAIKQDDVVGILSPEDTLDLDLLLRSQGSFNPLVERAAITAADTAAFDAWNLANPGDLRTAVGVATNISNQYLNLDPRELRGWDVSLEYLTQESEAGEFSFRVTGTKITEFEQQGLATTDLLRRNGNPEWRMSARVNWRFNNFNANLTMRYVDDVYDSSLNATGTGNSGTYISALNRTYWDVDSWTVYNLALNYDFVDSSGWAQGLSLTAGVRNLTDEEAPFADEGFGYLSGLHNSYGRVVWGQLTFGF